MGHPVHVMLVHFPVAFYPMSTVFDLLALVFSDRTLSLFSFYSASAGSLLGFIAMILGAIDLIKIPPKEKCFNIALLHGGLNFIWISIFTVIAGMNFKYYPAINIANTVQVIVEFLCLIGMIYSNFLGDELILKYGLGKKT